MVARTLVIGGYGNFGGYIARALCGDPQIHLVIGGRSSEKSRRFCDTLEAVNPAEPTELNITEDMNAALARIRPDIVIHTTGPFQNQDYRVARACINVGSHYIDLADARRFVSSISTLDADAQAAKVLIVSGASSVPCLTAAVIDEALPHFKKLENVDYGISAAQHTNRGLATTSAVLTYVGKPFKTLKDGRSATVYGWQDMRVRRYPGLGNRYLGNCDIPDLELFPGRYSDVRTIQFGAGHELKILQIGTWVLSWFVRAGIIGSLADHAERLLKAGFMFDRFGTGRSAFHMILNGTDNNDGPKQERFYLIARSGHGPNIPCMPAILMARQLAAGSLARTGAMPCLDLIDLDMYLKALSGLDIDVIREGRNA